VKPADAFEIRFTYGGEQIRMLSRTKLFGMGDIFAICDPNIFLKLRIDGKLKLFSYYYNTNLPQENRIAERTGKLKSSKLVEGNIYQK